MAEHHRGGPGTGRAEGTPVGGREERRGAVEAGREVVRVDGDAAEPGKVFQGGRDARRRQAFAVGLGDPRDHRRVGGNGPLGNARVGVEGRPVVCRAQVDHRAEVEIDAEAGEAVSLGLSVVARPLFEGAVVAGRDQRGEGGQGGQRWRQVGDVAAFLVGGHEQGREAGAGAQLLQGIEFGADDRLAPAADVVAPQIDAADQAAFRERGDFRVARVADHEMLTEAPHRRICRQHGLPLAAVVGFVADGENHHDQLHGDQQAAFQQVLRAPVRPAEGQGDAQAGEEQHQGRLRVPHHQQHRMLGMQRDGQQKQDQ